MLIKTQRPDGTTETRDYDKAGRLSYIVDKKDETIINSYYYGYDAVGNIVSITSEPQTDGVQTQTANVQSTQKENNNVQAADSVTQSVNSTAKLSNVQNAQMEYDSTNRLIKYNGKTVKYDADGNMTYGPLNGEMTTFVYDCRNRLIQAGNTTYQYDAENYRIGMTKHVGTQDEIKVTYVVDSGSGELSQILKSVETDMAGNSKVLYYFYGANHLVAQEEYKETQLAENSSNEIEVSAVADTYLLYHFNHVGSTTAITDESGTVKYQYQYSPYGELIAGTYGQIAFLYNGQYGVTSDDNGLYYMRARYYNIDIKRFVNQDVVTGSIERSSSLNRYAYVEGNPVSYLDPFGLEPWDTSEIHEQIETCILLCSTLSAGLIIGSIFFPGATFFTGPVATFLGMLGTALGIINGTLYLVDAAHAETKDACYQALLNAILNFASIALGEIGPIARFTGGNTLVSVGAKNATDWLLGYLLDTFGSFLTY